MNATIAAAATAPTDGSKRVGEQALQVLGLLVR